MSFELEEVINKYSNYVHTVATNMSQGSLTNEDIEEIISDVFLVFWQNKDKFDESKKINLYLAGIAKNLVRTRFRKIHTNSNIEDFEGYIIDNSDISYDYEQLEKYKIIEQTLNNMPKENKDIFILYYYYSKSIKEISQDLSFSEYKIKSKLFRIRKKLKTNLERGGYRYGK
ncbi:MAG: sigma-70 family RNA polymerase sigma factor [Clostridia bacterium]|nr:sigma-70 family RNA polymerase sigma factor [Clostridia bacterium]